MYFTVPDLSGKSMSQMSSCAEFLSFFFFFLEGSSGGFSRDSSSGLLISEIERRGESVKAQEGYIKDVSI